MNDFYRLLKKLKAKSNSKFAMATIISVDGSAYRRPGAKMLICEDGTQYGTISAGCLEDDLSYHAEEVIRSNRPKTLVYDLRSEDDLSWGQGAGCNGSIKVYVEPYGWNEQWSEVEAWLEAGRRVAWARKVSESAPEGDWVILADDGAVRGSADAEVRNRIVPALEELIKSGGKIKLTEPDDRGEEWLLELFRPRERLYVFGAGPDVEPLARLASEVDFHVTIIDPREARCNATLFPTADRLIVEHPDSYLENNRIPENAYVLIMTHSFQRDKQILNRLVHAPLRYLGVLGPRRRTERLLAPDPLPERIRSPVGLSIGAEGPEEISVSIVAELLQVRSAARKS